jgi:hypothetical protein
LKSSLPTLSKISHDGKRLFLSESPALTLSANCFSGEKYSVVDFRFSILNKIATPFSAWLI